MTADVDHRKRALRVELRQHRRAMTLPEREAAATGLRDRLVELTTRLGASSLAAYLPASTEPDLRPFLDWASGQGIRVLMPVSREDGLLDWVVASGTEIAGPLGVPEPVGERLGPDAASEVDLLIVPAASVDHTGMRLGWGRGYYDRTLGFLTRTPPVYAVLFERELVDCLPSEPHDRRVDGVVTPSGILAIAHKEY
jgi:5-formyltetrahydrofolate cyclo-ligase